MVNNSTNFNKANDLLSPSLLYLLQIHHIPHQWRPIPQHSIYAPETPMSITLGSVIIQLMVTHGSAI